MAWNYGGNTVMPTYQQPQMQTAVQMPVQNTYQWVASEQEVYAAPIAPGTEGMFMNSTSPIVYKKSVDPTGRPIVRIFDMVERLPEQSQNEGNFITRDELTAAVEEAVHKALKHNRKEKTNG